MIISKPSLESFIAEAKNKPVAFVWIGQAITTETPANYITAKAIYIVASTIVHVMPGLEVPMVYKVHALAYHPQLEEKDELTQKLNKVEERFQWMMKTLSEHFIVEIGIIQSDVDPMATKHS